MHIYEYCFNCKNRNTNPTRCVICLQSKLEDFGHIDSPKYYESSHPDDCECPECTGEASAERIMEAGILACETDYEHELR